MKSVAYIWEFFHKCDDYNGDLTRIMVQEIRDFGREWWMRQWGL